MQKFAKKIWCNIINNTHSSIILIFSRALIFYFLFPWVLFRKRTIKETCRNPFKHRIFAIHLYIIFFLLYLVKQTFYLEDIIACLENQSIIRTFNLKGSHIKIWWDWETDTRTLFSFKENLKESQFQLPNQSIWLLIYFQEDCKINSIKI